MLKYGVYAYVEPKTNDVVYIGIDSNIDINARDGEHRKDSRVKEQLINSKIREHNLTYIVIAKCFNKDIMYMFETMFIDKYKPKYNVKYKG